MLVAMQLTQESPCKKRRRQSSTSSVKASLAPTTSKKSEKRARRIAAIEADLANMEENDWLSSSSHTLFPPLSPSSSRSSSPSLSSAGPSSLKSRRASAMGYSASLDDYDLRWERGERWRTWCESHRWERAQDPGYAPKVGSKEVYRSAAMSYFRLKDYEIDTLPCTTYHCAQSSPLSESSYNLANLNTLVSRKFAMLAGLDEPLNEIDLLRRGWDMFQADTQRLTERLRMKGEKRKELVFCVIFVPRLLSDEHDRDHALSADPTSATRPRPSGSWTTRVYEDGVHIGEWLSLQYDPESEDYSDARKALVRFRPKNVAWTWA